jgi:hypothetical protein
MVESNDRVKTVDKDADNIILFGSSFAVVRLIRFDCDCGKVNSRFKVKKDCESLI